MTEKTGLFFCFLSVCAVCDIRNRKIANGWIFSWAAAGILIFWIRGSPADTGMYVLRFTVSQIVLCPLIFLRFFGGADIKIFGIMCGWLGIGTAVCSVIIALIIGVFWSAAKMIYHHNLQSRLRHFYLYIQCCILSKQIFPYQNQVKKEKEETIPVAAVMLVGTAVYFIQKRYAMS